MSTGRATTQSTFKSSMTILVSKLSFRTNCTLRLFHSRNGVKIMVPDWGFLELSFPSPGFDGDRWRFYRLPRF